MSKLRLGFLALIVASVSACSGSITAPDADNIATYGSGGLTATGRAAGNIATYGSGG